MTAQQQAPSLGNAWRTHVQPLSHPAISVLCMYVCIVSSKHYPTPEKIPEKTKTYENSFRNNMNSHSTSAGEYTIVKMGSRNSACIVLYCIVQTIIPKKRKNYPHTQADPTRKHKQKHTTQQQTTEREMQCTGQKMIKTNGGYGVPFMREKARTLIGQEAKLVTMDRSCSVIRSTLTVTSPLLLLPACPPSLIISPTPEEEADAMPPRCTLPPPLLVDTAPPSIAAPTSGDADVSQTFPIIQQRKRRKSGTQ